MVKLLRAAPHSEVTSPALEMTPEYRRLVRHTIVSLTVCSYYHQGCRARLPTTSRVRHNFSCVDARALHRTPRLGVDGTGSGHRARCFHGLLLLDVYDFQNRKSVIEQIEKFYARFYPNWKREAYYELMSRLKVAPRQKISRMSCGQRSQVALGLILAHI